MEIIQFTFKKSYRRPKPKQIDFTSIYKMNMDDLQNSLVQEIINEIDREIIQDLMKIQAGNSNGNYQVDV